MRRQTAFSTERFYGFLTRGMERERQQAVAWGLTIARGVLGFLGTLVVGATLMPRNLGGFLQVNLIGILLTFLYISFVRTISFLTKGPTRIMISLPSWLAPGPSSHPKWSTRWWADRAFKFTVIIAYLALNAGSLGVVLSALTAVIPGRGSPYQIGLIAFCVVVAIIDGVLAFSSSFPKKLHYK